MPQIKFKPNEDMFKMMQELYNKQYQLLYPDILHKTPMQLYKITKYETPDDWKRFFLDPRFQEWYKSESEVLMRTKAMELVQRAGDSKSQAEATQMNQLFNQIGKMDEKSTNETKIVYTFVDISKIEENIPNVNRVDDIPTEIKDAIQIVK